MQPQTVGQMSQTVLNQTILSNIKTDNIFIQYFVSFLAISFLGFITTRIPSWTQWLNKWIFRQVNPEYPTIKFTFTKSKSSPQIIGTTNAILAWLEKIKKSVKEFNSTQAKDEVKTIRSIATQRFYDNKTRQYRLQSHWLPDQMSPFLVDENIYVKLHSSSLSAKDGAETTAIDEYTLMVYTHLGLKYLLNYHDSLLEKFEMKLKSKFESQPHIFELESYDEKTKKLRWTFNEFTSSRKMDHVWFDEKNSFINAYKNFLFNKASYDKRGDPYTFSMLLYGPPGCGKTSLLKALINYDVDRNVTSHLFVIPFSKVETNDIFKKVMLEKDVNGTRIPMNQRIYVFEDFDANENSEVFNIRESLKSNKKRTSGRKLSDKPDENIDKEETKIDIKKPIGPEQKDEKKDDKKADMATALVSLLRSEDKHKSKLHLCDILNTLDGLCERTGQRCIWTTNKFPPQKHFDPAFLRPGRMDMIIKLGRCTVYGIEYLFKKYFDIDEDEYIDLNGVEKDVFTPAEVKQICKEAMDIKDAIDMMRKICHGHLNGLLDDNKELVTENGDVVKEENELEEPIPLNFPDLPPISRLHSGHWFDPTVETNAVQEIKLVEPVPNKVAIDK